MNAGKTDIVIIGAGPTGLGAAWRLNELGQKDWIVLESSQSVGGLASSVLDENGFLWDMGGHVLFSHYDYFDQVIDGCVGDNWLKHVREAWIWIRNDFIPYPLQNNIWRLPEGDLLNCIDGLLSVHNKVAIPLRTDSFEDWIYRNFGKGLADLFFLPYNRKVWAYEPHRLSANWIQERVATVNLSNILRNVIMRKDEYGWGPNSSFRFPSRGGTGMIWKSVAKKLPEKNLLFKKQVSQINTKDKSLTLNDGSKVKYEHLITCMPLNQLLTMLTPVTKLAKQLDQFLYSSINLVGVGIEGKPPKELEKKCWIYFVEDEFPFYRVTVFSNYSQFNVPKPGKQWSLLCEISESKNKPVDQSALANQVLAALKRSGLITEKTTIVSLWQKRLEYGYPTPFLHRDEILKPIEAELHAHNIYSRGRFGAWKYEVSNQDHSFMQGVEAVDHILFGTEELTYNHPSIVNATRQTGRKAPG